MSDARADAKAIFLEALDCPGADELMRFLDQACGSDTALRARVEELMRAHRDAGAFLGGVARQDATRDEPSAERPGAMIGPYKLLQQIGEGGMGTVWMAEQTRPVQRKVALKVIKPGMDSRQVIARFEAERQALALMDHVNIARVFDGGTTEAGRPYFVMELVHGIPITRYCDDNHLTPRERLELFVPVCQAIQHAHQKGIIHRDIKPSNVLVTLYDGKPVAKVIDFGVAKATEQKLTERTLFTQYGAMVGTLEYMSPEQAEMSALGVDTRSDIYSLGVLLYELLTGSTPLTHKRMKEEAYAEILRMIKEEEPPRPSTRLSDSGEALASISALRKTEPAKLAQLVRGELDWIVMKTLEKDRNRRYETANGFAADVQRYLNDEPVHACPPSAWYRFRKLVRRNRAAFLTASVVVVAVLLSIVVLAFSNVWIAEERNRKDAALREKDGALQDKMAALAAEETEGRRAEENLKVALDALDEVFIKQAEEGVVARQREGRLLPARRYDGSYFSELAVAREREGDLASTAELAEQVDRKLLQRGLEFYEKFAQSNSGGSVALQWQRGRAYARAAYLQMVLGQNAKAEAAFGKATPILESLAKKFPTVPDYRSDLANCYFWLAHVLKVERRFPEAENVFRQNFAVSMKLAADHPHRKDYRDDLFHGAIALAHLIRDTNRPRDDVELHLHEVIAFYEKLAAEFPEVREYRTNAVEMHWHVCNHGDIGRMKRYAAVLEQVAEAAPTPINRARFGWASRVLGSWCFALHDTGAEAAFRKAMPVLEKLATEVPKEPYYRHELANCYLGLGLTLSRSGRLPKAEEFLRQNFAVSRKLVDQFPEVAEYRAHLARGSVALHDLLVMEGRADEARAYSLQLLDLKVPGLVNELARDNRTERKYQTQLAQAQTKLAQAQTNLAFWCRDRAQASRQAHGWTAAAHDFSDQYLKLCQEAAKTVPSPLYKGNLAWAYRDLGDHLLAAEQPAAARGYYLKNLELRIELAAADPKNIAATARLAQSKWYLSMASLQLGDAEAREYSCDYLRLTKALAEAKHPWGDAWHLAKAYDDLAWCLATFPDPKVRDARQAVALARKAVELSPGDGKWWKTLGAAQYRAGEWRAAVASLGKSTQLRHGRDSFDGFFLAMAQWQLGDKEQARASFNQAAQWMDKNKPADAQLFRFRVEAAALMGLSEPPVPPKEGKQPPPKK